MSLFDQNSLSKENIPFKTEKKVENSIYFSQDCKNMKILEFSGEFENEQLFNGIFDEPSLKITFDNFYLQGRIIEKEFTVIRKEGKECKIISYIKEVVIFDEPPRFILK
ncbi:hypothetical protein NUSPORA_01888 [Nucleospora cyclopteri]